MKTKKRADGHLIYLCTLSVALRIASVIEKEFLTFYDVINLMTAIVYRPQLVGIILTISYNLYPFVLYLSVLAINTITFHI